MGSKVIGGSFGVDTAVVNFERYVVNETRFKLKTDFHYLSNHHFYEFHHGQSLLRHFGGFPKFLVQTYPSLKWNFIHSERTNKDYWKDPYAEKYFLEDFSLTTSNNIHNYWDWKRVDYEVLRKNHGGTILQRYSNILLILDRNFPEFFWHNLESFPGLRSMERRRLFVDRFILACFSFVETENDLKGITKLLIRRQPGGATILRYCAGRPQVVFRRSYPELNTKFKNAKQDVIHRSILVHNIKKKEDWYRLSLSQFSSVSGKTDVRKRNMIKLLELWLPEEEWEYDRFSETVHKKSRQRYLGVKLQEIFKNEVIHEEYKLLADNRVFVFDFYLPGVSLVVEYQGEQHYYTTIKWLTLEEQTQRDLLKIKVCAEHGLRLVHVPYWWNNSLPSLLEILSPTGLLPFSSNDTPTPEIPQTSNTRLPPRLTLNDL